MNYPVSPPCLHPPHPKTEARNDAKPSHESYLVRVGDDRAAIHGKYSHSIIYVQTKYQSGIYIAIVGILHNFIQKSDNGPSRNDESVF